MRISKQKRVPSDVAADSPSGDSLSFAGLVSIQEQCSMTRTSPMPPPAHAKGPAQVHKQDLEFEFSITTQCSVTGSPTTIPSADVVFSKGQFQTKATASHPDQIQGSARRASNLLPTNRSYSHRSNVNEAYLGKHTTGPNNGASNKTNKKVSGSRPWFQSFITPCRDCRVQEPSFSVKEQVLQQGKIQ